MTLSRNPNCRLCRLNETTDEVCRLGSGKASSQAMIVWETPPSPHAEDLLNHLLEETRLTDVYVTWAVHCEPPEGRTPTKAEINRCKAWLNAEIEHVKPKVVLMLGATALQAVLDLKGLKKIRGQPVQRDGITYLPTWSPGYVLRDDRNRPRLRADLMKFKAMKDGGGMPVVPGLNYRLVLDGDDVEDMLKHLATLPGVVYDCETTGLYQWSGKVISLNIGNKKKQWCFPMFHPLSPWTEEEIDDILERIDEAIKEKPRCNHNGKFDALWMKVQHGLNWAVDFDTMLAHHVLDENARHGLDHIAADRYGALDWDVPLEVKWGVWGTLDEHARYACLDVLYTDMMWEDFEEELAQQPGLHRLFYKLVMPASTLFTEAETHGVSINMEHLATVEKKLREDIYQLDLQLNAHYPKVNWGSPQQVAEVLFDRIGLDPLDRTEAGKPSTSESVLKRLAEQHPVPNLLMKRRAAQQQLSFFVEGWKPYIIRGRIHPSFKIHGTTTGRLSCANPNLQQVPRDFYIRQLITAKPGYVLIEADLSQIELRILAELSGDTEMMRCFQTGIDIHWLTALREIFRGGAYHDEVIATAISITRKNDIEYEDCHEILLKAGPDVAAEKGPKKTDVWPGWKEVRKYAKAINFGYAFGMWWKKFKDYARDNYDVIVTDEQAQASRQNYFDLYSKLPGWHNRQKAFARRHGYVRSLTGRKRRLPRAMDNFESFEKGEAERQSINSPVQGFASDLNLMVALAMRKKFSPRVFQLVGTVHDAILAEVRIDKVQEVVKFLQMILKHPPLLDEFDISMRVPLDGEIKIGPWGQGVSPEKWRP